ncbi:hypothetical protein MPTK1_7g08700 [Marchantia polymorpha subsp. ruderalis]|uniref:Uncharacterized protein n=2 Tax=Marchantia polymorpha TaxID=3197 RepID=A0AAF6BXI3_MARPO|nr:hypothetical protein MARPO_0068s0024 [Marchantia polymorpha]BBN16717.1 hypothetical protein Mp_7g08700 [Marchantia polymorpha subsp. ruderalis]|eukprot:PTQ35800.1 hypothetical protein MARPO_0068s0024 [Marchantia polymorpha]
MKAMHAVMHGARLRLDIPRSGTHLPGFSRSRYNWKHVFLRPYVRTSTALRCLCF